MSNRIQAGGSGDGLFFPGLSKKSLPGFGKAFGGGRFVVILTFYDALSIFEGERGIRL